MGSSIEDDYIVLFDGSQKGINTPGMSGPESNCNEGILHIPYSVRTRSLPSDSLVSYPGHLLGRWSYPFAEMQSAYSTAAAHCVLRV